MIYDMPTNIKHIFSIIPTIIVENVSIMKGSLFLNVNMTVIVNVILQTTK